MSDVVVTVPKSFIWSGAPGLKGFAAWLAEGDAPGTPWTGKLWDFTTWGTRPQITPGERVYVVCEGRLRGYAPLVSLEFHPGLWGKGQGYVTFVRGGGAVAVTIPEPIVGFRGWREVWWSREAEYPCGFWEYSPVQVPLTL